MLDNSPVEVKVSREIPMWAYLGAARQGGLALRLSPRIEISATQGGFSAAETRIRAQSCPGQYGRCYHISQQHSPKIQDQGEETLKNKKFHFYKRRKIYAVEDEMLVSRSIQMYFKEQLQ